jgi:protocatechuate 3,4-dioxygenase, beta subunit
VNDLRDELHSGLSSSGRFIWCKVFANGLKRGQFYPTKSNNMKSLLTMLLIVPISLAGCTQTNGNTGSKTNVVVGGRCEGCEAIHESPIPFDQLNSVDTLPDFNDPGPKIEISGIIYERDGKTPAKDVVLYIYHTDQTGVYPGKGNEKGWGKRHGYIRGWVKTDQNGFYKFYTLVPASYPNSKNPKHIHPTIKEKDKNEYWIDEYLFEGDPYLEHEKSDRPPRGGTGIIKPVMKDGMLRATRHIILGLNVEDYPKANESNIESGLAIGANCPAFDPIHLSGADKGKTTCPMCKYGYGQGVMVWFNHANLDQMTDFVEQMETAMEQRGEKKLRVFMVYMNPLYKENDEEGHRILRGKIQRWCEEKYLRKVAMVWIPSPVDEETAGLFNINPEAKNTVLVYKKRKVAAKWVNIEYTKESTQRILNTL